MKTGKLIDESESVYNLILEFNSIYLRVYFNQLHRCLKMVQVST